MLNIDETMTLAVQHLSAERLDDAAPLLNQIVARAADFHPAYNLLGIIAFKAGKLSQAAELIAKASALAPEEGMYHRHLSELYRRLGRSDEAVAEGKRATELRTDDPDAHYNLGFALAEKNAWNTAILSYRRALELNPQHDLSWNNLGVALEKLGDLAGAEAACLKAIELNPANSHAHFDLGGLYSVQGRLEDARRCYENAISISPDGIGAHSNLAKLKTYREDDPHLLYLEHSLGKMADKPINERIRYWFTLGKAREDVGRYDDAFAAYAEGNRLQQSILPYDEVADCVMQEQVMTVFSRSFFKLGNKVKYSDKAPVFIVGMPRSGTTLLEQILSNHPAVYGAGELTLMDELVKSAEVKSAQRFPNFIPGLTAADFARMGESYAKNAWNIAPDAICITDKQPFNFLYVGLIRQMLPNAKIIHAMRDPMDSCFSCYSLLFTGPLSFTYDLGTLGRYYARYIKLMRHWHTVLPAGSILDVRYEDMVADTEGQARRIIDYLELPWDDNCLAFHQNKRQVKTASIGQVRKPIYQTSVARWERFAQHLTPLLEIVRDYRESTSPASRQASQQGMSSEHEPAPQDIDATVALFAAGRYAEAAALARTLTERFPLHGFGWKALGVTLKKMGQSSDALTAMQQAAAMLPNDAEAHNNLGDALRDLGQIEDAIKAAASCRRAIELKPDFAEAHNNLGNALRDVGRFDEAVTSYRQALKIRPDYFEAHSNLSAALKDLGRLDEAIASCSLALEIKPDYAGAYSNLLFLHGHHASLAPQDYLSLARGWELACIPAHERQLAHTRKFTRPPFAGRRLRVGYVSGDYRQHAVSYFIEQIFAHHDKTRIELFAYSACGIRDAVTERIQAHADHWVPIVGMTDAAARDRIDADGIDVLIDLSGHTLHNRMGVFARRAAPVQAYYLGYFASTGLTEMDYWIGDEILTPAETDNHFSEQVWRLPRISWSYGGKDAPLTNWHPAPDGVVWVGSFNGLSKLTPATLALWAKVLHALPEGKLLLKTKELSDVGNRQRTLNTLSAHGISPDRIELRDNSATSDWSAHMAYYDRLDIALDPVGAMGGVTTTCDALWMGVPVIALGGDRVASRATDALLTAIGHPEWIARNEAEYVDKVVALARDEKQRQTLRPGQRERMAAGPLCDAKGLSTSLENAYFEMFERWLAKQNTHKK